MQRSQIHATLRRYEPAQYFAIALAPPSRACLPGGSNGRLRTSPGPLPRKISKPTSPSYEAPLFGFCAWPRSKPRTAKTSRQDGCEPQQSNSKNAINSFAYREVNQARRLCVFLTPVSSSDRSERYQLPRIDRPLSRQQRHNLREKLLPASDREGGSANTATTIWPSYRVVSSG